MKRPNPISYFRCSKSQSVDCNARLIVPHIHTLPFEVEEKGAHTCAHTVAQSTNIIDVQEEMKNLAAAKALGNIAYPLESYNRILNTVFPTPHPSLAQFIEVIKQQSIGYVHKLDNIRMRREERPNRVPFVYPPIPPHYIAFRQAHMHE